VKFLTGEGFTVFMVSWRNPTAEDREIAFDDYRSVGVDAAVATVREIMPDRQIHALGLLPGRHASCRLPRRRWREMATPD
jgi:polyhydroxyalkanoate synthase